MPMMSVCIGNFGLSLNLFFRLEWLYSVHLSWLKKKKELGAHVLINLGFPPIQQLLKGFVWQHSLDWPILRTMGKAKKLSDDLRRRIVSLHTPFLKKKTCRFQCHQSKQLYVSYLDVWTLCQTPEEDPNWLECSWPTQKPPRLKPAMTWKLPGTPPNAFWRKV